LAQWRCAEVETLCGQYGIERKIRGKNLPPLIKSQKVKEEFFPLKFNLSLNGVIRPSKIYRV